MNKIVFIFYLISTSLTAQVTSDYLIQIHEVSNISEMNTISTEKGALIFNVGNSSLYVYEGSIWKRVKSNGEGTKIISGNNIEIMGNGSISNPYKITEKGTRPVLSESNNSFIFSNGIDPEVTFNSFLIE